MNHRDAIAIVLNDHPDSRVLRRLPAIGSNPTAPPPEVAGGAPLPLRLIFV